MPIEVLESNIFHLFTERFSYVLQATPYGILHRYWGHRIVPGALLDQPPDEIPNATVEPGFDTVSRHALMLEVSWPGGTDYRDPLLEVVLADGSIGLDFRYRGYHITEGKPPLPGLPALRAEAGDRTMSLGIDLEDLHSGLCLTLQYAVLEDYDVLTRSVRIDNRGTTGVLLRRILSLLVDRPDNRYDVIHWSGAWAREREEQRYSLGSQARWSIESRRGSSSHQEQPALWLARHGTGLHSGEVWGVHLIYSGNFLGAVQEDEYGRCRLTLGINPTGFGWHLAPGEHFQAPEALMVYSDHGTHGVTARLHRVYRERLMPKTWRSRPRPIVLNTWEAAYFAIDELTVRELGELAADVGIECLVLDDGWFGQRQNDRSSLGDWEANPSKFPEGLEKVIASLHRSGLQVGLWIEPEMISPDSDLYRMHPEWCLAAPGRHPPLGRHQWVLDLTRDDVQEWMVQTITDLVSRYRLDYLKWDWNRPLTEGGSLGLTPERQGEMAHRYVLGLYRVLDRVTRQYPELLIEGCAAGGGRFDPGMLAYTAQIWPSDNTDAIDRLWIQANTAQLYPISAITAHVSAVPNHQTGRKTPMEFRARVASSAVLGYELDLRQLGPEELEAIRRQIAWYKAHRQMIQQGEYLPVLSKGTGRAWMFWDTIHHEGLLFWFSIHPAPNRLTGRLIVPDLATDEWYQVTDEDTGCQWTVHGSELGHVGIPLPRESAEYRTGVWRVRVADRNPMT